jgi:hypothetical protein
MAGSRKRKELSAYSYQLIAKYVAASTVRDAVNRKTGSPVFRLKAVS